MSLKIQLCETDTMSHESPGRKVQPEARQEKTKVGRGEVLELFKGGHFQHLFVIFLLISAEPNSHVKVQGSVKDFPMFLLTYPLLPFLSQLFPTVTGTMVPH